MKNNKLISLIGTSLVGLTMMGCNGINNLSVIKVKYPGDFRVSIDNEEVSLKRDSQSTKLRIDSKNYFSFFIDRENDGQIDGFYYTYFNKEAWQRALEEQTDFPHRTEISKEGEELTKGDYQLRYNNYLTKINNKKQNK